MAALLLPHIAGGEVQGSGDLFKHRQIQPGVGQNGVVLIPEKVAGESGGGDDVGPGLVEDHVAEIRHARLHQLFPHRKGDGSRLLAEQEEVDKVVLPGGGLDQIAVAKGEGVGVHHHGGAFAVPPGFLQGAEIACKAVPPVFQKDQRAVHTGDLIEAQVLEDPLVFDLGV